MTAGPNPEAPWLSPQGQLPARLARTLPSFESKPLISFAGAVSVCLRSGRNAEQIEGAALCAGGGGEDGGEAIAPEAEPLTDRLSLTKRLGRTPTSTARRPNGSPPMVVLAGLLFAALHYWPPP